MISSVSFEGSTYNVLPFKFEAGTPDFVNSVAMAAALDYISDIGLEKIAAHEQELLRYAMDKMSTIEGIQFVGTAKEKTSVISYLIDNIHPYDMGTLLDRMGIAIRTGHHCAEPLMRRLGIEGTMRASFAPYNTFEEIDSFVETTKRLQQMF